jgi:phosphatidylcholine synthase
MMRALALAAHLYTALGLVAAAGIAAMVVRGGDEAFRSAFALMAVATLIDGTDGWLARLVDVHRHAPDIDGRRLDDIIDFQTYTSLPLLLLWRAGTAAGFEWCLLLALVASAYGFSQTRAKTEDNYFLGFPSYWNVVAFYLYLLPPGPGWKAAIITTLAVLTFVPTKYLYPSRGGRLGIATNALAGLWTVAVAAILWLWRDSPAWLVPASLAFPLYYMAASWWISLRPSTVR